MHSFFAGLISTAVVLILFKSVSKILADRRYAAEAKRLGCKPPPVEPNKWPLGIDQLLRLLKADREMLYPDDMIKHFDEMQDWTHEFSILGNTALSTVEPKNIQAMLATQFHDFALGPTRRNNFLPLLGNGIFTADGKGWEHSRSMMRPSFTRDQVSDLDLEERHVKNLMCALPVESDGWTSQVDLQVLFFRLTLDSACEFLFGESVDSQIANLPENASSPPKGGASQDEKNFATAFDRGQSYLARRVRFRDRYWLLNPAGFRQSCRQCHDFIDHFVNLALNDQVKEKEVEKGENKPRYIFLEALVAQTRDPIELRSQLLNILLAGRDTTASLLGWLYYVLATRPAVYQKLRAAIIQDFGTYQSSSEITFAALKDCQYLQNCLNETLRLHPVVPLNSRRAVRDTTLPRGGGPDGMSKVFIRKDQQVDYSVHVMHRRKDLWGEDADEFKPERWVGRKPGWEYLPFNGGPRICLGRRFRDEE